MANPAMCGKCGSILMGYGWSQELKFPVYFCTQCSGKETAVRAAGGRKEAA